MRETIIERINKSKLIAIVRGIADEEQCLRVAEAIYNGGIDLIEVTFNQSAPESFSDTTNAVRAINKRFGDQLYTGVGTVLTTDLVSISADADAKFIISPDTNVDVIKKTRSLGLVSIPGAFTATEIAKAAEAGADFVKLFPGGLFGGEYIKAVKAPLSHVKILAVGGVSADNIPELLACGCDGFGIGGNLVNKTWIDAGQYDKITEVARSLRLAIE